MTQTVAGDDGDDANRVAGGGDDANLVAGDDGGANANIITGGDRVTGFDTGPANTLMDDCCRRYFDAKFDDGGAIAGGGEVHENLLEVLLADEYFKRAPPKSTGREYFHHAWLQQKFAAAGMHETDWSPQDLLATLSALTAASVAAQINALSPEVSAIYVCGGGAFNGTLMTMLAARCNARITTTADLGIAPQWVEAAAFAWLAHRTMFALPSVLPSVTGARIASVAGAIYPVA